MKKNDMNNTSALALMSTNASLDGLTNAKLREAAQDVFNSFAAIDTSMGCLAYSMRKVRDCFKGLDKGEKLDGYTNFAEFAEKRLGVKKAQAYNLAKAGDFIRPIKIGFDGEYQRTVYVDEWVQKKLKLNCKDVYELTESEIKSFSNTAILRMAEFINTAPKKYSMSEDEADKRVEQLVKKGEITPDMSVNEIMKKLIPVMIEQKPKAEDNEQDNEQSNEQDNEQDNEQNNEQNNEPEYIEFRLGKEWFENNLKPELLRFAEESPAIAEFLKKFQ